MSNSLLQHGALQSREKLLRATRELLAIVHVLEHFRRKGVLLRTDNAALARLVSFNTMSRTTIPVAIRNIPLHTLKI